MISIAVGYAIALIKVDCIRKTIETALSQQVENSEYLLVDDGSAGGYPNEFGSKNGYQAARMS
jgi:hypothetical protein